jgi:hypothetical protein
LEKRSAATRQLSQEIEDFASKGDTVRIQNKIYGFEKLALDES